MSEKFCSACETSKSLEKDCFEIRSLWNFNAILHFDLLIKLTKRRRPIETIDRAPSRK